MYYIYPRLICCFCFHQDSSCLVLWRLATANAEVNAERAYVVVVVHDESNADIFPPPPHEVVSRCLPGLELGHSHFLTESGESCSLCTWCYKITFPEVIRVLNLVNIQISTRTKNICGGLDVCSMCPVACSRCSSCIVFSSAVSVTLACGVQEGEICGSSTVSICVRWTMLLGTRLSSNILCQPCVLKCLILQKQND